MARTLYVLFSFLFLFGISLGFNNCSTENTLEGKSLNQNSALPNAPFINSFTASATSILAGQSVTLTWNISNELSALNISSLGSALGKTQMLVTPNATQTYVLQATNSVDSSFASLTITVTAAPPPPPPPPPPPVVDAFASTIAQNYSAMSGIFINNGAVAGIDNGDYVKYSAVNFDTGALSFTAEVGVGAGSDNQVLQLRIDSLTGPIIGELVVQNTGDWFIHKAQTTNITATSGVHDLFIIGVGTVSIADLKSFVFSRLAVTLPTYVYCSDEGGTCNFSGTRNVRYGANDVFAVMSFTGGTACTNLVFGDPIVNVFKQCWYESPTLVAP